MPVYIYKSKDGDTIELIDSWKNIKEKYIIKKNGKEYKRVLQTFSPRFIGSGFHSNDYGKGSS